MTSQLETELRAALRTQAGLVPPASIARLARLDYSPRTRALRPPLAIGAAVGATGAAGAAVALVSFGAGASNAFAGWTAKPTKPLAEQIATAVAQCHGHKPVNGLPLKLTDTRGPFTFSVYANDESSTTCVTGPSFTSVSGAMANAQVQIPAGRIQLMASRRTDRDGRSYSFAEGHTGAGVSAVELMLDDGTSVDATVANGWFVAWWPSAHQVSSADITTPTGVKTQTFHFPRAPQPAGGKDSGSSIVSGAGNGTREGFSSSR